MEKKYVKIFKCRGCNRDIIKNDVDLSIAEKWTLSGMFQDGCKPVEVSGGSRLSGQNKFLLHGKTILISSALKTIIGLVYTVSATIFFNIKRFLELDIDAIKKNHWPDGRCNCYSIYDYVTKKWYYFKIENLGTFYGCTWPLGDDTGDVISCD